jgi:hypothetical protein
LETAIELFKYLDVERKRELKIVLLPVLKEVTNNIYDTPRDFNSEILPYLRQVEVDTGLKFDLSYMAMQPY